MPDFKKSKVYKIVALGHEDEPYVGSTTNSNLIDRLHQHKLAFKYWYTRKISFHHITYLEFTALRNALFSY